MRPIRTAAQQTDAKWTALMTRTCSRGGAVIKRHTHALQGRVLTQRQYRRVSGQLEWLALRRFSTSRFYQHTPRTGLYALWRIHSTKCEKTHISPSDTTITHNIIVSAYWSRYMKLSISSVQFSFQFSSVYWFHAAVTSRQNDSTNTNMMEKDQKAPECTNNSPEARPRKKNSNNNVRMDLVKTI